MVRVYQVFARRVSQLRVLHVGRGFRAGTMASMRRSSQIAAPGVERRPWVPFKQRFLVVTGGTTAPSMGAQPSHLLLFTTVV